MTVGLIFECGPQGADKQVCEYLAAQLKPGVRITSATLDNKENLLRDAGKVAARMLKDGCACVLIVWDLRPAWPDMKNKPCRHGEREALLASLTEAGLPATAPVYLVCIEQELESWLLACDHAIAAYLSTPAHAFPVKRIKAPDAVQQPKAAMVNHFRNARNWRYEDRVHAIRVFKAADMDLKRMRRSVSFARFESKLAGCVGG